MSNHYPFKGSPQVAYSLEEATARARSEARRVHYRRAAVIKLAESSYIDRDEHGCLANYWSHKGELVAVYAANGRKVAPRELEWLEGKK